MRAPLLVPLACAAALPFALARIPADRLPQAVRGDGALSVAFGDAREAIGRAMVHKADSYFHGGIDMDCGVAHVHRHGGECGHGHAHGGDCGEGAGFDPWRWINSHVRAPSAHRHLEGRESVELMPWFWAAVRAAPHDIDAWTTAWYVANNMMKDGALAGRVLDEGLARNPGDLELLICRARMAYAGGGGDLRKARGLFAEIRDEAAARCGGDLSRLSERERQAHRFAEDALEACSRLIDGDSEDGHSDRL